MPHYLLIESRDPFESNDAAYFYDLAGSLADKGNTVTLFLVQNGVLPARPSRLPGAFKRLADSRVRVLADDFSLRERGIPVDGLAPGVRSASLDVVVDGLAEGAKVLWH